MAEGVRHDYSPIGLGKNWVTEAGGLPPMIRDVAHALLRDGHPESDAIQLAVGAVQRWARGEGKVQAATRAKAAAAIAQWEAMKGKARSSGSRDAGTVTEQGSAGSLLPVGPSAAQSSAITARLKRDVAIRDLGIPHAFRGGDPEHCSTCDMGATAAIHRSKRSSGSRTFNPEEPREHGKWAKVLGALADAVHEPGGGASINPRTGEVPTDGFMVAEAEGSHIAKPEQVADEHSRGRFLASFLKRHREKFTPTSDKHIGIWHDPENREIVLDPSDHIVDRDQAIAEGVARNQQSIYDVAGDDVIDTGGSGDRDKAVHWSDQAPDEPEGHLGDDRRGDRGVRSRSRDLLGAEVRHDPAAPGGTRQGDSHAVALVATLLGEGWRTDVADHPLSVSAPALPRAVLADRNARKALFNADADQIEPQIEQAMTSLFARQAAGTLSRLKGRRGSKIRNIAAGHRAETEGQTPEGPAPESPAGPVDVSAIFDPVFWAQETTKAIEPVYAKAAELSIGRVHQMTRTEAPQSSLGVTGTLLRARANRMAGEITDTTHRQITASLAEGVDAGESMSQLTDRVQHVFDVASRSRASNIARTETIGSLNEAAVSYAAALPSGTVGRKQWLAHHDSRTRPSHRMADGQTVNLDQRFHVGASLMSFPGDPDAPPDETCQCRCSLAFLPALAPKGAAA